MRKMARAERSQAPRINAIAKSVVFAGALAFGLASHANLVLNGGFDAVGTPVNVFISNSTTTTSTVPNWFMGGSQAFERVYSPGCGDNSSAACGGTGVLHLAGPVPTTSPAGGNFFALDADPTFSLGPDTINQFISVVPGLRYVLSFWYAAGQDLGRPGNTQEAWQVTLGGTSSVAGTFLPGDGGTLNGMQTTTTTLSNPSQSFTGWVFETLTFIAPTPIGYTGSAATSELLTFLGVSPNGGLPPILLLDGLSVNAAPEPGSLALLSAAFAGLIIGMRKRR